MANILDKQLVGQPMISVKTDPSNRTRSVFITLNDQIINTELITSLLHVLANVSANDNVVINLGSIGGNVYTCVTIVNAFKACKAKIKGIINGIAASSCAIIASHCDELEMSDYGLLMFHGPSSMFCGNVKEVGEFTESILKMTKQLTQPALDKGILTEEDFTNIFENKCDLYLTKQDLQERGVL